MPRKTEVFYPRTLAAWRRWLEKNHESKNSVWVVFYSKKSGKKSIMWTHAVDVALCFGWIDSKKIKIDEDTSHQFFSKRKPRSTWSRINKEKIEKLIASGEMTPAGLAVVETAKQNGSWFILDEVEDLIIPQDLQEAFEKHEGAKDFFMSLSKSNRKIMLSWIALARLPQTRQTRVEQVALQAAQKQKPV